nr:class I poly(R)-hydroxyalkanoic acid synthase [Pseudopontixanthobacter vadosimaris]
MAGRNGAGGGTDETGDETGVGTGAGSDPFGQMLTRSMALQAEGIRSFWDAMMPRPADDAAGDQGKPTAPFPPLPQIDDMQRWNDVALRLQQMWLTFQTEQAMKGAPPARMADPAYWIETMHGWYRQMPLANPASQQRLFEESMDLWQAVLGQFGIGPAGGPVEGYGSSGGTPAPELPRKDRRFKDERWRAQPGFALIHQTYLLLSERIEAMVDEMDHVPEDRRDQLRFATKMLIEAMSPANIPALNPVVLERTVESRGENLVRGMENLIADMKRGQLTHTDPDAFTLGANLATTPGKVVHETPLYQLIQYSPATEQVFAVPLLIFPPWINRFYILDLNPEKSFIRWAVDQGLTVFVVSWKSADSSMAEVVWDDYIRAQIEAIDHVRERLDVPSVHTIGYCVAGTTLAATLAILARRDEAEKVKSATFFTAQVDFENAGELLHFIDDQQIAAIGGMETDGYIDGRLLAATFNLLRGTDLIWNYVVKNYLLGEGYPAFDLLHWNGDVTNLPARWHREYLKDLYRDNLLVKKDRLSADGTPIDLSRIETPCYIQAGREDHIAPASSVWRLLDHLGGPARFVLAGSGHIAGVVNPPAAGKYQYWTNPDETDSLDTFISGATEHKGSWWPDWIDWTTAQDDRKVKAAGKRKPGGKGDTVIEDAPGRYVKTR